MKKLFFLAALLCAGFFCFGQEEEEASSPKAIQFITDASGSMWQKVDGEYKIVIAKEVLGNLVSEMPDNQSMGLVAYGHRKKGDCNDIEELLPVTNTDKAAFLKHLKSLNPIGKTPLARSAKLVIEKLKSSGQAATVILITDGIETCDGDLCQIVKDAKAAGVDFVLHVIGFDLKDADRTVLECAAEEGGGKYVDADDKLELNDALEETSTAEVIDEPESVEPEVEHPGRLTAKVIRNGELIDAMVNIYIAGTDNATDFSKRSYTSIETNPIKFELPLGTFDVEATPEGKRALDPIKYSNVEVTTDDQELVFDFSSGKVEVLVTKFGELQDASVKIISKATGEVKDAGRTYTSSSSNPLIKELPAGEYAVELLALGMKGESAKVTLGNIVISAGETTKTSHDFAPGKISIKVTNNGELHDTSVSIDEQESGKRTAGGRTYTSASSNPMIKEITPGTYDVTLSALVLKGEGTKLVIEDVVVKGGETTTLEHDFKSCELTTGATSGGELVDAIINITSKTTGKKVTGKRAYGKEITFMLTPDTYEVTVNPFKLDGNPKKTFTVTLEAGDQKRQVEAW
ncbi:MAG: VWA domain-containing protein [Bacteroidota bacterium]